jgi:hypothetical protein
MRQCNSGLYCGGVLRGLTNEHVEDVRAPLSMPVHITHIAAA